MKRAAETVAWFAFGGDREDWINPLPYPWSQWLWLKDWVDYFRWRKARSS